MDGHGHARGGAGDLPALQYQTRGAARSLGRCSACCSRVAAALCSNVGVCAMVLLYTVAGAFLFATIEGGGVALQVSPPPEAPRDAAVMESLRQEARGLRHETVEHLWTITESLNILYRDNWTRVAEQELLKFSEKLLTRLHEGGPPPQPAPATAHTSAYQWTFAGSFLYSLTVITTIGYGSVAPQTALGRVVTIVYALLGIPLMLLYLSSVGDLLSRALKWVWWRLCRCRRRRRRRPPPPRPNPHTPTPYTNVDPPSKRKWGSDAADSESSEGEGGEGGAVPVTLCLLLMVTYICGGAAVFARAHHWSFLHAVYFCFSSLTTIGFGDLAPAVTPAGATGVQVALLGAALYLLVGMALIATCFNLMQEQMTSRGYGLGRRMASLMGPAPPGGGGTHRFHLDDT
ncbi:TWiK family of potassium channels protein 7-like [Eriocheir sinensis]|uniref:TWiK family of potassium channels protein 7-like n=1 Tax=Eriocheir sinensis TaxID=95602 RepID=UPI0021C88B35|nr:TWiK family of potassium channels protein 7-like [Eriocheir sinensis]XP_050690259.1 TWiK family of potassium channels protein 7-like [Eriocheir sinensis]XP_050690260.1 TWiK family of potassium channels protein 7-like [Eriocheir sinensis]